MNCAKCEIEIINNDFQETEYYEISVKSTYGDSTGTQENIFNLCRECYFDEDIFHIT